MGLSVVLGEALRFDENGIPLKHLRTLNLLKAKNSPPIQSSLLMTLEQAQAFQNGRRRSSGRSSQSEL